MTPDVRERRASFRKLHERGCFVIPNPWDVGSARYLRHLGFEALATTSSGFAFSRGQPDADWAVPCDVMLAHIAEMVAATELPVNADFRSGYAREPDAYAAAGADVVFAPGVRAPEDIRAIVKAVHPTPVNVVMGVNIGLTVSELADLSVRRVSVGSGLARAAWTGFMRAAKLLAQAGSVSGFDGSVSFAELDGLFREDRAPDGIG